MEVEGSPTPATMGSLDALLELHIEPRRQGLFRLVRRISRSPLHQPAGRPDLSPGAGVDTPPALPRGRGHRRPRVRPLYALQRKKDDRPEDRSMRPGLQAAYDFYLMPEVAIGVFAGYRIMRAKFPGDVFSFFAEFRRAARLPAGTIERQTEITLPDLSIDGSGPFVGLRIGFRVLTAWPGRIDRPGSLSDHCGTGEGDSHEQMPPSNSSPSY